MDLLLGDWFLLAMSAGYVGAAVAYWIHGNNGYALALMCYALANVGLVMASK